MGELTDGEQQLVAPEATAGDIDRPSWVVAKSLLEVNRACDRTLEDLLLYATEPEASVEPTEVERRLDAVIERHERLLDDLRLAKHALDQHS